MTRRGYRTINLPEETVRWLDALFRGENAPRPLGIASRDEAVRIALAIFGALLLPREGATLPPDVAAAILRELERMRKN